MLLILQDRGSQEAQRSSPSPYSPPQLAFPISSGSFSVERDTWLCSITTFLPQALVHAFLLTQEASPLPHPLQEALPLGLSVHSSTH